MNFDQEMNFIHIGPDTLTGHLTYNPT